MMGHSIKHPEICPELEPSISYGIISDSSLSERTYSAKCLISFPFASVTPQAVTWQEIQTPEVEITFIKAGPASKKMSIYLLNTL